MLFSIDFAKYLSQLNTNNFLLLLFQLIPTRFKLVPIEMRGIKSVTEIYRWAMVERFTFK